MTTIGLLDDARNDLGLSVPALWLAYFELGGTKTAAELGRYLVSEDAAGGGPTSDADHDAVVHALNEAYADLGIPHRPLPYRAG